MCGAIDPEQARRARRPITPSWENPSTRSPRARRATSPAGLPLCSLSASTPGPYIIGPYVSLSQPLTHQTSVCMGDSWASQTAPRLPCPVVSVQRHFGRLSHSGHSPNPLASLGPAHPLGLRTCHWCRYAGQRGATLTAVGSVVPLSINSPGISGPGGCAAIPLGKGRSAGRLRGPAQRFTWGETHP